MCASVLSRVTVESRTLAASCAAASRSVRSPAPPRRSILPRARLNSSITCRPSVASAECAYELWPAVVESGRKSG